MPPASEVVGKGSCILCFTLGAGFLKQGPPVHSGRSVSQPSSRSGLHRTLTQEHTHRPEDCMPAEDCFWAFPHPVLHPRAPAVAGGQLRIAHASLPSATGQRCSQADEVAWPLSLPKGVGACWEIHTILFFSGLVLRTQQLCQPAFSPGDPHHPPRGSQPFLIAPFHEVLPLWL